MTAPFSAPSIIVEAAGRTNLHDFVGQSFSLPFQESGWELVLFWICCFTLYSSESVDCKTFVQVFRFPSLPVFDGTVLRSSISRFRHGKFSHFPVLRFGCFTTQINPAVMPLNSVFQQKLAFDLPPRCAEPHSTLAIPAHEFEILACDWNKYNDCVLVSGSVDKSIKLWVSSRSFRR